jgi:hypothetical protein
MIVRQDIDILLVATVGSFGAMILTKSVAKPETTKIATRTLDSMPAVGAY